MEIPVAASGAITVALIVILGTLVYPALLRRRLGAAVVAVATVLLAALFFAFDRSSGVSGAPVVAGIGIALVPLAVGILVYRLQRGGR